MLAISIALLMIGSFFVGVAFGRWIEWRKALEVVDANIRLLNRVANEAPNRLSRYMAWSSASSVLALRAEIEALKGGG